MGKNNLTFAKRGAQKTRIIEVIFSLLMLLSLVSNTSVTFTFPSDTISSNFANKCAVDITKKNQEPNDNNSLKKNEDEITVPIKEISLEQFIHFDNFINSCYIFAEELSFEKFYTFIYILDFLEVEDTLLLEKLLKVLFSKLSTNINDHKVFMKNYIQFNYGINRRISFEMCKNIFLTCILLFYTKKIEFDFMYYEKNGFLIDKNTLFCLMTIIIFFTSTLDRYLISFIESTYISKKVENIYFLNYNLDRSFFKCLKSLINVKKIIFLDNLGDSDDYNDFIDELKSIECLQHAFINHLASGKFKPKDDANNLSFSYPEYFLRSEINPKEVELPKELIEKIVYYKFFKYNYLFWEITGIITEDESINNLQVDLNYCRIVNLDLNEEFILANIKGMVLTETEMNINVLTCFLNISKIESLILNNIKITNPKIDVKFTSKNKSIKSFEIVNPKQLYKHHLYEFIDLLERLENLNISFDEHCLESENRIEYQRKDIQVLKKLKYSSKVVRDKDILFIKNLEIIENLVLENIKDYNFFTKIFKNMVFNKIKYIWFSNCEIYKIENDAFKLASIETIGFKNCVFTDTQICNFFPSNICKKITVLEFKGIKIIKSDMEYLTLSKNFTHLSFIFCIFDEDAIYDFPAGSFKNIIVIYLEYHNEGNNKMIVQGFREKFSENILRIHFFNHL
ncbi:hypothetical protein CWI37_0219p0020 [Hamiltosporidium tvaerminnensis]|uniref:Uncharacterized protein n=1 Tax=Hamiltosporidium tvaerminnensis TaxID=1176355 RepID=A0A4Q9L860_9MICR|nr:hypothetical protein CWI37_0219p0020 [Hamiltosporidium tvaerminnensis]